MTRRPDPPELLDAWRRRFERELERTLPPADHEPPRLHEAMRYSALAGGKRIRPLLTYAAGHALGVQPERLDPIACAVELIHAYSLIHDDLPAMDDDALRRGRPTCHLAFDEATAILAGDALQALAFAAISERASESPGTALRLIAELARACGSTGMAGGQMLDLAATGGRLSLDELERVHRLKTGALIGLSVRAPAIVAAADENVFTALDRYGQCVGLGFQIRDDILDVTGDAAVTGKPARSDEAREQPTFPALIGIDGSSSRAESLCRDALECLESLAGDTAPLAWLAEYMIRRDR